MAVINTNYLSLVAQNNLNKSQSALGNAIERLSSGLRINSAKDDAAGQAIANRMTSQVKGLNQAQRNANDGISIAQTAEGGLNQINENLQRIRELSVQAQNGTNSASDIDSIQQEVNQRLEEINRIAQETDFNGTKILSKNEDTNITIQVGAQDNQVIDIKIDANGSWNKYDSDGVAASTLAEVNGEKRLVDVKGFDVLSATAGTVSATVNGADLTGITGATGTASLVTNDGNLYIRDVTTQSVNVNASDLTGIIGEANTANLVKDGAGNLYIQNDTGVAANNTYFAVDASMIGNDGKVSVDVSTLTATVTGDANFDAGTPATVITGSAEAATVTKTNYYAVAENMIQANGTVKADLSSLKAVTPSTTTDTAFAGTALATLANNSPLAALDEALKAVDNQRSQLGAIQNRFESAITNLQTNSTNLQAARSRIEDADYAVEVANMTKNQILQQAGTSVLAQANQIPQGVLSLLR